MLNEKVVYPGHGVARVDRIVEKKIAGEIVHFLELVFIHKDMTVLVPVHNVETAGIRKLSSVKNINDLLKMLADPSVVPRQAESFSTNWNKRSKEYQGRLRTGSLWELCAIYKDLRAIEIKKELSFGEKSLLHQTEALLVEEIALVKQLKEDVAIEQLRSHVCFMPPSPTKQIQAS